MIRRYISAAFAVTGLAAACASRTVPRDPPPSSPVSPEALAAPAVPVTRALAAEPAFDVPASATSTDAEEKGGHHHHHHGGHGGHNHGS